MTLQLQFQFYAFSWPENEHLMVETCSRVTRHKNVINICVNG